MVRFFFILVLVSVQADASKLAFHTFRGGLACTRALTAFDKDQFSGPDGEDALRALAKKQTKGEFPILDRFLESSDQFRVMVYRGQEAKRALFQVSERADTEYRELEKEGLQDSIMTGKVLGVGVKFSKWVMALTSLKLVHTLASGYLSGVPAENAETLMAGVLVTGVGAFVLDSIHRLAIFGIQRSQELLENDIEYARETPVRLTFIDSLGEARPDIVVREALPQEVVDGYFYKDIYMKNEDTDWTMVLSQEKGEPVVYFLGQWRD